MYAQRTKQANIGKLLASLGLGGLIGGGIGRVSGYNAGNQAGYSEGSANASKDTLINLLKGMTGVVQQGAESKLDLKKLLESKSGVMPSIPMAPLNAESIKTAKLRRVLYRIEKSAAEKQAIASLLAALKGSGGKARDMISKQIAGLLGKGTTSKAEQQAAKFVESVRSPNFKLPKIPDAAPVEIPPSSMLGPKAKLDLPSAGSPGSADYFRNLNRQNQLEALSNARLIPEGGWPPVVRSKEPYTFDLQRFLNSPPAK